MFFVAGYTVLQNKNIWSNSQHESRYAASLLERSILAAKTSVLLGISVTAFSRVYFSVWVVLWFPAFHRRLSDFLSPTMKNPRSAHLL